MTEVQIFIDKRVERLRRLAAQAKQDIGSR